MASEPIVKASDLGYSSMSDDTDDNARKRAGVDFLKERAKIRRLGGTAADLAQRLESDPDSMRALRAKITWDCLGVLEDAGTCTGHIGIGADGRAFELESEPGKLDYGHDWMKTFNRQKMVEMILEPIKKISSSIDDITILGQELTPLFHLVQQLRKWEDKKMEGLTRGIAMSLATKCAAVKDMLLAKTQEWDLEMLGAAPPKRPFDWSLADEASVKEIIGTLERLCYRLNYYS